MLAFQLRKQSWTGETILAPCSGLFPQLKHQHFNVVPALSILEQVLPLFIIHQHPCHPISPSHLSIKWLLISMQMIAHEVTKGKVNGGVNSHCDLSR